MMTAGNPSVITSLAEISTGDWIHITPGGPSGDDSWKSPSVITQSIRVVSYHRALEGNAKVEELWGDTYFKYVWLSRTRRGRVRIYETWYYESRQLVKKLVLRNNTTSVSIWNSQHFGVAFSSVATVKLETCFNIVHNVIDFFAGQPVASSSRATAQCGALSLLASY